MRGASRCGRGDTASTNNVNNIILTSGRRYDRVARGGGRRYGRHPVGVALKDALEDEGGIH